MRVFPLFLWTDKDMVLETIIDYLFGCGSPENWRFCAPFLPRDAMIVRHTLWPCVRLFVLPSVRPSVTNRCCFKTFKHIKHTSISCRSDDISSRAQRRTIAHQSSFLTPKILLKSQLGHLSGGTKYYSASAGLPVSCFLWLFAPDSR